VTAGQIYNITIEYFHGTGEAILDFKILRRLNLPQAFNIVADKANNADAVIFVGGITPNLEGEEMPVTIEGFAGGDRTLIELPRVQRELLEKLKALGKPIVFVICAGSAIAFDKTGLSAVLDAFYPGEAGGVAVADVLFGDYNPAGRLPVTFYTATEELDDFNDYNMSTAQKGRTYRYYKRTPLYPFGHGLSYTTFLYEDLVVTGNPLNGDQVTVTFTVRNTGTRPGDEVIQIYVSAVGVAKVPIKSLRWFKRQKILVGAKIPVTATIGTEAFQVFDDQSETLTLAPGVFRIAVGGSSAEDALLTKEVTFSSQVVPTTPGPTSSASGMPGWAIAVVVLAVLAVAVVVVFLVLQYFRRSRHKYEPATDPSARVGLSLV
jgi:beta-glucosidase